MTSNDDYVVEVLEDLGLVNPDQVAAVREEAEAKGVSALDLLVSLPLGESDGRWRGNDLRYWGLVAKLGLEFLAHHKYLPALSGKA